MNTLKQQLINKAKERHKKIYPVSRHKKLSDCFTCEDGVLIFWFNTKDGSTHVLRMLIELKPN